MDDITKGGEGSGVRGHMTNKPKPINHPVARPNGDKVVALNNKIVELNPFKEQVHKLKEGAVWEGKTLPSGQAVYNNVEQATAHGYTPEDFRAAGNMHYEAAQKLTEQIDKIKALKKEPPKDMQDLANLHNKKFKQAFAQSDKLAERMKTSEESIQKLKERALKVAGKVKKSVVMMGQQDAAEIDTGKFANEHSMDLSMWMETIHQAMKDYKYGDVPVEVLLNKATIHLVKVDDGMYSGFIKTHTDVLSDDGSPAQLHDTAKVRIERMTIPSLVQFLKAKEYISQPMEPIAPPLIVASLDEAPMAAIEALNEKMTMPIETELDKKIRILELINKLTSPSLV